MTLTKRAVRAAVQVGLSLDLDCTSPALLNDSFSVIVHLAPSPVVARVATLTPLIRPDIEPWLAAEIALAGWLRDRGAAVVGPFSSPGPYWVDGLCLSLWELADEDRALPTPAEVGSALSSLHEHLRHFEGALPHMPSIDDVPRLLALGDEIGLDAATVSTIRRRFEQLLPSVSTTVGLRAAHGDAHPRNLIRTSAGWRWIDFEECCRAPLHWDLATLARTSALDGLEAITHFTAEPVPPMHELKPFMHLRKMQGALWDCLFAHNISDDGYWRVNLAMTLADTAELDS